MINPCWVTTFLLLLAIAANNISCNQELKAVQTARVGVLQALNWVRAQSTLHSSSLISGTSSTGGSAWADCGELYRDSEARFAQLLTSDSHSRDDVRTWLSGALASHGTCLDGLNEHGFVEDGVLVQKLIREALALYGNDTDWDSDSGNGVSPVWRPNSNENEGLLASWDPSTSSAHIVVAQDGSGSHRTINDAVAAATKMGQNRPKRVTIHVKSGVYNEQVEIGTHLKNVMLVGDGMDKTIVTGNRNVPDGSTTYASATVGVSGDGFWARGITFENTAGPHKYQAVALRVNSDLSIFYRCSFKGFQDTLFVHSLRQFYRECQIHGTIDFIFGDAAAIFQNCDIFVKKPMYHQSNVITAQGRDDPNSNTGIVIHGSRILPSPEFSSVKGAFKSYLGRPWKKYSRTVILKSDLDGLIDPKGWTEWSGNFALSTLFYAEYMNQGIGASTENRVKWHGFHVLINPEEASPFTAKRFIQGDWWISASGVPFSHEI